MYDKLVDAGGAIHTLHSDVIPADEREREKVFWEAGKRTSEVLRFFDRRQIYFDEELCAMLRKHSNLSYEAWLGGSPYVIKTLEQWKDARSHFDDLVRELPAIRGAIEQRMREILGVVPYKKSGD